MEPTPKRREFLVTAAAMAGAVALGGCSGSARPSGGRCVLVELKGGPSQIDTFDPKETSWFSARATPVDGLMLSENFAALAEHARDLAFVRSMVGVHTHHELAAAHLRRGLERLGAWFCVDDSAGSNDPTDEDVSARYVARLQAALLAAEQGPARLVCASLDGWDIHVDGRERTRVLSRALDHALDGLFSSTAWRRLRDDTVILITGEFGRAPDLNVLGGRGHHAGCWTAVVAGGAIRGGTVRGATDSRGGRVLTDETTVDELHATILAALGEPSYGDAPAIPSLVA